MSAVAEYTVAPRVREFLSATHDPATGEKLVDVAHGGAEDIDRAVRAARSAFDRGPWPTMNERSRT